MSLLQIRNYINYRFKDEKRKWSHKKTDERFHGLVAHEATSNSARKSQNAQFWDLQKTRLRVENTDRERENAFHRWSQTNPSKTYARPSRLQISTEEKTKKSKSSWISLYDAVSFGSNGSTQSRYYSYSWLDKLALLLFWKINPVSHYHFTLSHHVLCAHRHWSPASWAIKRQN